ncbi:hypothetical protein AVEN_266434-1 [Araneus ventricosus]|uniref:Uncharacterized protein n=1 Tax=Araneus ventricosus TaxID=182803 RepID=A0A4Y2G5S7_ARAVE|nr:hypothetical protein AVEN_266434-1 [Araneus ventricosus]
MKSVSPAYAPELTRRGHDLGNSVRDETWNISSIPLRCSPINLVKCNGQPIRRKWPSNLGHRLYTIAFKCEEAISNARKKVYTTPLIQIWMCMLLEPGSLPQIFVFLGDEMLYYINTSYVVFHIRAKLKVSAC